MKKIILILAILLIGTMILADDTPIKPKIVLVKIAYGSGSVPAEGTVTFDAWFLQHGSTFVTQNSVNCGYIIESGIGYMKIDCAELSYDWSSGDDLFVRSRIDLSGEQYTYGENTFVVGDGSFESFDVGNQTPLAVTLSSFTAVLMDGTPRLQWITQSEMNNAGWNVYRSETEDLNGSMQINPELIQGSGTTTIATEYEFEDENIENDKTYYYWLESLDYSSNTETYGPITIVIPGEGQGETPPVDLVYGLHDAFPNPFNPETTIEFILQQPSNVDLSIYNIKGQKVITLCDDFVNRVDEPVTFHWDGKDAKGNSTGSGVYFYLLQTQESSQIKKMVLIK